MPAQFQISIPGKYCNDIEYIHSALAKQEGKREEQERAQKQH